MPQELQLEVGQPVEFDGLRYTLLHAGTHSHAGEPPRRTARILIEGVASGQPAAGDPRAAGGNEALPVDLPGADVAEKVAGDGP